MTKAMTKVRRRRPWNRTVIAAMLGAAVAIACSPTSVRAQDNEEEEAIDTRFLRGMLHSFGFRRDEAPIDYRERSPLVLPPDQGLPAPERANPARISGWPNDPDVKRAKQLKEARKKRSNHIEGVDDRPLLPSEYGRNAPPTRNQGNSRTFEEASRPSSHADLGSKSIFNMKALWGSKEEYVTFAGEPPRTSLTDPPAGYLTPSPHQPYGLGNQKWEPKPIDRHEQPR